MLKYLSISLRSEWRRTTSTWSRWSAVAPSERSSSSGTSTPARSVLRSLSLSLSLSLWLSLIYSFAYEVFAWLTRLLLILQHLWGEGMRLLFLFLQMYTRGKAVGKTYQACILMLPKAVLFCRDRMWIHCLISKNSARWQCLKLFMSTKSLPYPF